MNIALISLIISVIFTIIGGAVGFIRFSFKGGTIFNRLEQVEKNLSETKHEVSKLHDSMITVKNILMDKVAGAGDLLYAERNSPRTLNELGEKLFNEMHGAEFIEKNKDKLFAEIDKRQPQTALDVERVSRIVCLELAEDSIFNPIKDFVYNCPMQKGKDKKGNEVDIDMTLDMACAILYLPLRDAYLAKHPELDPNRKE